jgi:hypothetical protein
MVLSNRHLLSSLPFTSPDSKVMRNGKLRLYMALLFTHVFVANTGLKNPLHCGTTSEILR